MKSLKVLSLVLIATSLASGAVYARSGGGMGGGNGMHSGGMGSGSADHAQQIQHRTQTRTQTREASQGNQGLRNEYRYENRDQIRNANDLPSM